MSKRMKMKAKPKALKGAQKQTEGFTPSGAMPTAKRAGKARAKRLEKVAV